VNFLLFGGLKNSSQLEALVKSGAVFARFRHHVVQRASSLRADSQRSMPTRRTTDYETLVCALAGAHGEKIAVYKGYNRHQNKHRRFCGDAQKARARPPHVIEAARDK
jgi:hypothetical protein